MNLELTVFEAKALWVFLAAHIVPTPTHLRGPIPDIMDRLQVMIDSAPTPQEPTP